MRAKLSPVFTSGKLKEMFPLILECANNLEKYVNEMAEKGEPVEFRDIAGKFTTDAIGHCVFGINMNALGDKDSEFRKMGKRIFTPTLKLFIRDILRQFLPRLYGRIGHRFQPEGVDDFMINVIQDTISYRKQNKLVRPDFVNMLMELKEHPEKLQNIGMYVESYVEEEYCLNNINSSYRNVIKIKPRLIKCYSIFSNCFFMHVGSFFFGGGN